MSAKKSPNTATQRKPEWLRINLGHNPAVTEVEGLVKDLELHTVCKEAFCPNRMECYRNRSATFMILGSQCSRNCTFCNVTHHRGLPAVDTDEPKRLAEAAKRLGLQYAVITSVTRDDLPLGGAEQFVAVIQELQALEQPPMVEVLIPDFQGNTEALRMVVAARPRVLNHNIETIARLYPDMRPEAEYQRSLELLRKAKELAISLHSVDLPEATHDPTVATAVAPLQAATPASAANHNPATSPDPLFTKSGFMVGVGETEAEVFALLRDLRSVHCDMVTIGQYLPPSKEHFPLYEYVTPKQFDTYKAYAKEIGFLGVASGPLVRSSYHAVDLVDAINSSSPKDVPHE